MAIRIDAVFAWSECEEFSWGPLDLQENIFKRLVQLHGVDRRLRHLMPAARLTMLASNIPSIPDSGVGTVFELPLMSRMTSFGLE